MKKAISLIVICAVFFSVFTSLPVFGLNGEAQYKPVESNLSVKYWVTAKASSNSGNVSLAIDGDNETAWMADEGDREPYIELDLGGAYDAVRKTEVVFAGNDSIYKYKIEGSKDGNDWYVLADRTGNTKVAAGFTDIFSQSGTRYIRLTITGGNPVGVREFKVINYLRGNMKNGSDMSEQGGNTLAYYYNLGNNPPEPGYRGGKFSDEGSLESGNNIFGLVKDLGWDVIRLRVWNEPKNENTGQPSTSPGNCSPENTLRMAKYIVNAGLELAIDFHYSDSWADPQNQPKPYAWAELSFDELVNATYEFTYDMISDLIEQGTPPSIVAIGNEITNGMMWGKEYDDISGVDHHHYYNSGLYQHEYGGGIIWKYWHKDEVTPEEYQQYLDSFQRLARLVDAGIKAVRKAEADYDVDIDAEIHCAFNVVEGQQKIPLPESEKFPKVMEFITQLTSRLDVLGSSIDRIGISYYPDWHGSWAELQRNLIEISKVIPDVKLNISECSPKYSGRADAKSDPNHPEGFQYSIQSQGDDTAELLKIINDVPDNRGQGVWPWAGTNVFFTGGWGATQGEPRASMKVWKDAYATNVVESGVYVTTKEGEAPVLPSTVKNLDVATGVITDVPVEWDAIDPQKYAESGTFTVNGIADTEGNMKDVVATVSVLETDPVIGIVGPEKVIRGKEFDLNLTLTNMEIASENLPEDIYAADITVNYDADLFDFVKSNKVNEKTLICDTREIGPGAVRIILSSNEKYIADNSMVKLTFRAKNVDESTSGNIRVEKALLGTAPIGYVVNAAGDVLTVSVDVIPGDVNGDGEVNIADLSFTSFYYSVEAGDPNWEAAKSADINNDGKIDLIDLVYVAYRIR
ncbi:MAG TPA: hypothetical protein GXX36_16210 [Clostridiaceae bacterium]|nr:hypothetical protein [Clostridiaceae bacterium]